MYQQDSYVLLSKILQKNSKKQLIEHKKICKRIKSLTQKEKNNLREILEQILKKNIKNADFKDRH